MRIAVIPARGGSKRIPRKNIRPFAGKPMIAYAIEAALSTGVFDHVVVSTDDTEIAEFSASIGAETPFMRPADLADDYTATVPVIAHAIQTCRSLGWHVEQVCCIYPCVPFIRSEDILQALSLLNLGGTDYVFPVTVYPSSIQRALRRAPSGSTTPFSPEYINVRSQDLEAAYYDAGQFYWGWAAPWLNGRAVHASGKSIVLPSSRVVDIDTQEDWIHAERLYEITCSK